MHSRVAAAAIDKATREEGEEVKLFDHYQSRLETNTTVRLAVTYLLSG
jgi:oligoribonuclease NrnB/cAMP/cGMP phosphodiesterase (DHH superfamily)